MKKKEIQEFVSVPISLTLETTIDGTKFYSSENLKQKFVMAFEKSSKGDHISSEIEKLVQKKLILPCYKSKNLFSFIKNKIMAGPEKYILAFYHTEEKRVIVLIENEVSIIGTAANNSLVSTTLHESMHLAAGQNLSGFLRIFKRNLSLYYTEFISDYFKIDKPDSKKIDSLIKHIAIFERRGPEFTNKKLGDYYRFIASLFMDDSKLDQKTFEVRLTNMIIALKLFIVHTPTFLNHHRKFVMILTSLNYAYEKAFKARNNYTTPIQELYSLSEVACVLSEINSKDSSIKQIFKMLT